MKRRELIRHLEKHGCELLREGAKHTAYVNRKVRKSSTIPPSPGDKRGPGQEDLPRPGRPQPLNG